MIEKSPFSPPNAIQPLGFQYKAPCNPYPQPPQQKSNLESFKEHFIQTQIKTNETLGESVN